MKKQIHDIRVVLDESADPLHIAPVIAAGIVAAKETYGLCDQAYDRRSHVITFTISYIVKTTGDANDCWQLVSRLAQNNNLPVRVLRQREEVSA